MPKKSGLALDVDGDFLRSYFAYNPDTGDFDRKEESGNGAWRPGTKVGVKSDGVYAAYTRVTVEGVRVKILLGRLAWFLHWGEWPDGDIHYSNEDLNDHRIENLRVVDDTWRNRHARVRKTNRSGAVGVHWEKNRGAWCSSITVDYKCVWLGCFAKKADAVKAYAEAARKYHGEANRVSTSVNFEIA